MKTRNNGAYHAGYYKKKMVLKNSDLKHNSSNKSLPVKFPQEFNKIINSLNVFIIKNLKKTKNPIKRTNIEISLKFKNFLENYFDLGFKFNKMDKFLNHFGLVTERIIKVNNLNDCLFFIQRDSFEMKLNKKSYINYINKDNKYEKLLKNFSVSVKFIRDQKVILNDSQNTKLQNYLNKMF